MYVNKRFKWDSIKSFFMNPSFDVKGPDVMHDSSAGFAVWVTCASKPLVTFA